MWELTPAAAYFLIDYLRRGATGRSLAEVRHFYALVVERISNHLDIGRNLASAFRKGGETASAATIFAMYVPPKNEMRDASKHDKKAPARRRPNSRPSLWTATATASKPACAQTVPTAAIATYADDATERVMESTSAAAAGTAREAVRGTKISAWPSP